jgi:hypothetical protein
MLKADTTDLTIGAIDGNHLSADVGLDGPQTRRGSQFILVATGGPLTEISLLSTSGIKEAKRFEASAIAAIPARESDQ